MLICGFLHISLYLVVPNYTKLALLLIKYNFLCIVYIYSQSDLHGNDLGAWHETCFIELHCYHTMHTGTTNKEFNFRHDWNSLISDDESLMMRHYSKAYFPPADSYVSACVCVHVLHVYSKILKFITF